MTTFHWQELDERARDKALARPAADSAGALRERVAGILADVKASGDAAVMRLTKQFDGVAQETLAVSEAEFHAAEAALAGRQRDAIRTAIDNVRRFHERQLPANVIVETMPGVRCERITHPIDAVGLYVPAGTAPLPSAAVMLAVPAAIAGCPVRVMCTPPRRDGTADPAVLVAAASAGVTRVFKVGGAQAIAAMAYGTETIPAVNKLFGPGNAWVTAAKTLVSADPDGAAIDLPAGPSEVLVIADRDANPAWVAADLLSQAEHGSDSQVVLVTDNEPLAATVGKAVTSQLDTLSRRDIAAASLAHARTIVVDSIDTAIEVSNRYAPEHLILQCADPQARLPSIRNAGSVFLGPWTPEAVGDYCSGTNHVLPTYGYARSYSGLGVDQFLRRMTVQQLTRDGLLSLAQTVTTLAELE
ncbi:MAG: histidinol dehydrogenase, partial [Woeseiaceae bacterium]|nr:histidinol dehydrogenase [Woeseiaceae bacterium]